LAAALMLRRIAVAFSYSAACFCRSITGAT
jgi:hypothetical protein